MEESAGQYGTLKDGVITFPAQSILLELEKEAGSFFYGNRNGMHRILMPGVVIPDYTVTLAKSEPKEGVVEIAATFAADAREMKYAVFEGVLDDGQASLTAQDMDKNKDNPDTFQGSITESGTIRVENRQTGKYTLVGCIYDEGGARCAPYAFVSFGYVAADDEKPVILTVGLEATNEYAGQGLTSDNSAKFYAYGEGIESAVYGLFRSSRLEGIDKNALLDSQGTPFTEEQLAQLNDKHFSVMLTGLNGDSEYTLLMRASNGYISEIKEAAYKTTGTYNPAMEDFVYEDFLSAEEQPSVEKLRSTAWNYYAMDLMDYSSEQPMRRKIGSVTMTDNPEITAQAGGTVLNVDGLSGIDFESGGSVFGFYIPGNQTFDGYNGVLALYTDKDLTPATYKGKKHDPRFHAAGIAHLHLLRLRSVRGRRRRRIPLLRTVARRRAAGAYVQLLLHRNDQRGVQHDDRDDARRSRKRTSAESPERRIAAHRRTAATGREGFRPAELRRAARVQRRRGLHGPRETGSSGKSRGEPDAGIGSLREAGRRGDDRRRSGRRRRFGAGRLPENGRAGRKKLK